MDRKKKKERKKENNIRVSHQAKKIKKKKDIASPRSANGVQNKRSEHLGNELLHWLGAGRRDGRALVVVGHGRRRRR